MAQALLQNAGMTSSNKIDFSKSKTIRLASQKIGKNLYHQVYDVVFVEYSGRKIQAIAVHDASNEEWSMSDGGYHSLPTPRPMTKTSGIVP
jgi:hypothetical protein